MIITFLRIAISVNFKGIIVIGMSFMKRILSRSTSRCINANKQDKESERRRSKYVTTNDKSTQTQNTADAAGTNRDKEPFLDIFDLGKYLDKRDQLEASLKTYRNYENKTQKRKEMIVVMNREMEHLRKLITRSTKEIECLDEDICHKKHGMAQLSNKVPSEVETEIKRKEPLYFKRYSNVKTSTEARNLITAIRQRLSALRRLEMLTFKKYLDSSHELKVKKTLQKSSPKKDDKKMLNDVFKGLFENIANAANEAKATSTVSGTATTTTATENQSVGTESSGWSPDTVDSGIVNPAFESSI